jgi:N-acetyl-gamma-glutamyl-phosphate reductase
MVSAAIVGGSGYTGAELMRLLSSHPEVRLQVVTSRAQRGVKVGDVFPNLRGHLDLSFSDPADAPLSDCDVVFCATPNGTAMQMAPGLLGAGCRLIDLSADFRLRDPHVWQQWYGLEHACPELLEEAVYGLPETHRKQIRGARLIANPGCYPTAVQLGLLPLLEAGVVEPGSLIADTKSGVSGAGRSAEVASLLCEAAESMKAYKVSGHRHQPEIEQQLQIVSGAAVTLTFVPHLTPMIRGIHATLYAFPRESAVDWQALFESRYAEERFIDVLAPGAHPETRSVRGSNVCRLAVHQPRDGGPVVVLSIIDNLLKGAAGQAVQNMNIMLDIDESTGLEAAAMLP